MEIKEIIRNARERMAVEALTPMQHKMAGLGKTESAVLTAPTGSGKTLAFALAMLQRVKIPATGHIQAAVIAPSRELVLQITKALAALAPKLRITAVYGGHSVQDETRSLEAATPDVVVGTPGRLLDHINRGRIDLYRTATLVLDEYDKSLELGFADEMRRIVRSMRRRTSTLLTSATRLAELPDFMQQEVAPTAVDFSAEAVQPQLAIHAVKSPQPDKLETLAALLNALPHERTIVFVNHRESAERVADYLVKLHYPVALYHGALEQLQRETAIDLFVNGSSPILVATDLAARGLDIPQVRSVIHYHLPTSAEAWTHRCGRTGRMGAEGDVYVILGPTEQMPEAAGSDSDEFEPNGSKAEPWRRELMSLFFHSGKKEKLSRGDIVGALVQVAGMAADDIGVISVHDHRALVAVPARMAAAAAAALSKGKIKGRKVRVTTVVK
jgi:superfamily II DNA/RNA helicase